MPTAAPPPLGTGIGSPLVAAAPLAPLTQASIQAPPVAAPVAGHDRGSAGVREAAEADFYTRAGLGDLAATSDRPAVVAPPPSTVKYTRLERPQRPTLLLRRTPAAVDIRTRERTSFIQRVRLRRSGMVLGLLSFSVGAVLSVTPGPGAPFVLVGLYLLSAHFAWAKRALEWVRTFLATKVFHGDHRRLHRLERMMGMRP